MGPRKLNGKNAIKRHPLMNFHLAAKRSTGGTKVNFGSGPKILLPPLGKKMSVRGVGHVLYVLENIADLASPPQPAMHSKQQTASPRP